MIQFLQKGDIFESKCDAIVNTVNTVGVMGAGVAKRCKELYPANFTMYKAKCDKNALQIGSLFIFRTDFGKPRYIINFPTKIDWKDNSKYEYIQKGLETLVYILSVHRDMKSIAIPPLGCGNGKLDWTVVKEMLLKQLQHLKHIDIRIYEPIAQEREIAP